MDSESRTGVSNQGDPGKIRNYADLRNVKPGLQCTARGFPVLSTMWWTNQGSHLLMNVVGTQMDRLSQNRPSWWAHWHSIFDSHWSFWFYPIFCWFYSAFACLKLKTSSWAIFLRFAGHEKHNQLRAAYSYWNVANTVPLQAAGWADFSRFFNAESWTDLGPMASQELMYDALILAKQRVTNSAPDWGRPQQFWGRERKKKKEPHLAKLKWDIQWRHFGCGDTDKKKLVTGSLPKITLPPQDFDVFNALDVMENESFLKARVQPGGFRTSGPSDFFKPLGFSRSWSLALEMAFCSLVKLRGTWKSRDPYIDPRHSTGVSMGFLMISIMLSYRGYLMLRLLTPLKNLWHWTPAPPEISETEAVLPLQLEVSEDWSAWHRISSPLRLSRVDGSTFG